MDAFDYARPMVTGHWAVTRDYRGICNKLGKLVRDEFDIERLIREMPDDDGMVRVYPG
jgi:hypothetical protein